MKIPLVLCFPLFTLTALRGADPLANPQIDYRQFKKVVLETELVRENHRLTEAQFLQAIKEPGTVLLDARSPSKYAMRHIEGAINLAFTDFTAETLAGVIPWSGTKVLIYCNNNFEGAPVSMAAKNLGASLNLSTYTSLRSYGYTNVFELGPLLDVKTSAIPFAGSEVQ